MLRFYILTMGAGGNATSELLLWLYFLWERDEIMELFSEYMKVFLQIANIVIILYGGYKFLGKPHSTLEQRVSQIEKDIQDIKVCLKRGNCKFQDHDEGIEVIVLATIALIEFEIQYCTSEHKEVSKALDMSKERLHAFLAKRKGLDE